MGKLTAGYVSKAECDISGEAKKLVCSGRDMFLIYKITGDIEESIEGSVKS